MRTTLALLGLWLAGCTIDMRTVEGAQEGASAAPQGNVASTSSSGGASPRDGADAGTDAGADAWTDAGADASPDAGTRWTGTGAACAEHADCPYSPWPMRWCMGGRCVERSCVEELRQVCEAEGRTCVDARDGTSSLPIQVCAVWR